ncbi:MAG TPA: PD-(D/E)XK nuclease family protein [Solirubrobacteraceae bacterium]|nr:PD-(D/E)XK nuclease family protein [Solirubrobacteraceae bacterium]
MQEPRPAAVSERPAVEATGRHSAPASRTPACDAAPAHGLEILTGGSAQRAALLAQRAQALIAQRSAPESILLVGVDGGAVGALRAALRAAGGPKPRVVSALGLALELVAAGAGAAQGAAEPRAASRQARLALAAEAALEREARHQGSARRRALRMLAQELERIDVESAAAPGGARRTEALSAPETLWAAAEALQRRGRLLDALAARYSHLLVAGTPDLSGAGAALIAALAALPAQITIALPARAAQRLRELLAKAYGDAEVPVRELPADVEPSERSGGRSGVELLLCADRHARARWLAAEVEAQLGRDGRSRVAVVLPSLARDGRELAGALRARHLPFFAPFAPEMFAPPPVRDLLAWLRLLLDPHATEAMRLLLRPPALPPAEAAHVSRLLQGRRLDLASAAAAVAQAPQCSPAARERIHSFLELHSALRQELAEAQPWTLLPALIWRAGLHELSEPDTDRPARCAAGALAALQALGQELAELRPDADAAAIARDILAIADAGLPLVAGEAEDPWGEEGSWPEDCTGVPLLLSAADSWAHPLDVVIVAPGASLPSSAEQPQRSRGERSERERSERELGVLERWLELGRERALVVAAEPFGTAAAGALGGAAQLLSRRLDRSWERIDGDRLAGPKLSSSLMRGARKALIDELEAVGSHLGELRLDSEQEIAAGVSAALAYMKLAALRALPAEADPRAHSEDLDARLLRSASPQQRELFHGSPVAQLAAQRLPELLAGAEQSGAGAAPAIAGAERSLAALLPRRGQGLVLSASDLDSFRSCPLRFKFARLLHLPRYQTPEQRFGIAVHRALERFHARFAGDQDGARGDAGARVIESCLGAAWQRVGLGRGGAELYALARDALLDYQRSLALRPADPVWLERSFAIRVGPHTLRGRVDRVDRIDDRHYEIIDYKTSRARPLEQLEEQLQLEVYGLAAQEEWGCEQVTLTYSFIIDGVQVRLPQRSAEERRARVAQALEQVAGEILALRFTPRPSYAACAACDFLAVCPAVES